MFTVNVDDLLEQLFSQAGRRLRVLSYPDDDILDRDQSLAETQLIHLNGRLPCIPTAITFATSQFARAAGRQQPLYEQFVRDFVTHPVVFVGTQLNEPLFWQALEARQDRAPGIAEHRPESFLVAPRISPAKAAQLARFNVTPIEASGEAFLAWLSEQLKALPDRRETLKLSAPDFFSVLDDTAITARESDLIAFAELFGRVPLAARTSGQRSVYLLGGAPRWEDLFHGLDAPRTIASEVFGFADKQLDLPKSEIAVGAVLGSAGSGKSTILRRVGILLAQRGRTVYLTNSESRPSGDILRRVVEGLPGRVVLLFDNAEIALPVMPEVLDRLRKCERPPLILFACRTNDFDRLWGRVPDVEIQEFPVPHLNRGEIKELLNILEREGLLGELRGLAPAARIQVFEGKAQKQLLVAMREATTSRGFDGIVEDEFAKVVPEEAQILYASVALATEAGYRLTKEEYVACARVSPAEALHLLSRNLRDIVVATGYSGTLLLVRHRLIAEMVVERIAPRPLLREAYVRLLSALALGTRHASWRTRAAGIVRALLDHKDIYRRFKRDLDEARAVFRAVTPWFSGDAHFWLQSGNLELEGVGGDLVLAENYLAQARSLAPDNVYVRNAIGHLTFRKAIEAPSLAEAVELRREAVSLLSEQAEATGYADPYAVHIQCHQRLAWARRWWSLEDDLRRADLEELREILKRAVKRHPRHQRLKFVQETVERAYLELSIPFDKRPEPPSLPSE